MKSEAAPSETKKDAAPIKRTVVTVPANKDILVPVKVTAQALAEGVAEEKTSSEQPAVELPAVFAVKAAGQEKDEVTPILAEADKTVSNTHLADAARDAFAGEIKKGRSAAMARDSRNGLALPSGTGFRADSNTNSASIQMEIANGDNSTPGIQQKQGKITVTGGGTKTEDLGYIDVTFPTGKYIQSFDLNGGSFAQEYERIDNADGSATFRIKTGEITPTTSASIYFGVNYVWDLLPSTVKDPKSGAQVHYTEQPKVVLYGGDKSTVLAPTKGSINFDFDPSKNNLEKRVIKNNQWIKDDNQVLDGGLDKDADGYIDADSAAAVEFKFTLNNIIGATKRRMGEITSFEDVLPTYVNKSGQTVRATFNKAENPLWNLSADGTKVVFDLDAYNKLEEKVYSIGDKFYTETVLKLHFPDAKDRVYLTNKATLTAKPVDQRTDLGEPDIVVSDDIKFYLTTETIPKGYFEKNSGNKNSNSVRLYEGSAHLSYGMYSISLKNPTDQPLTEFTITDENFDSRLYLMAVGDSLFGRGDHELYAIKNDGTEEKIDFKTFGNNFKGTDYDVKDIIDKDAYLHNKENAEKIEAGTLKVADAKAATASYKGFKIKLKEGQSISPGLSRKFNVYFGFLNPLDLNSLTSAPIFNNTAKLDAKLNYKGQEIAVKDLDSTNFFTVQTQKENVGITKKLLTNNGFTGNVGSKATYEIRLSLSELAQMRKITNAKIVDVLPKGFELEKIVPAINNVISDPIPFEIVENYKNSGQQAVIINLGDFRAADFNITSLQFTGTITDEMIPEKHVTATRNNINRIYFMADNLNPDQIEGRNGSMLPDKYDIDGDGDTKEKVYGAEADIKVNIPTELKSIKYIGKEDAETKIIGWTKKVIETDYNEDFFYRLTTQNFSTYSIKNFVLYDRLPLAGDSRDSKFVNTLRDKVVADERFEVFYHTATDMSENPEASIKRDGWLTADQVTDFSKVTALKIQLKNGEEIDIAQTVDFDVPMTAPKGDMRTGLYNGKMATNNYYTDRTGDLNNFGVTNSVSNKMVASGDVKVKYLIKGTDTAVKDPDSLKENASIGEAYTSEAPNEITRREVVDGYYQEVKYRLVGLRSGSAPASGKVTKDAQTVIYDYEPVSNIQVRYYSTEYSSSWGFLTPIKDMQTVFSSDQAEGTAYDATTEALRPNVISYQGRKYRFVARDLSIYDRSNDDFIVIKNGVIQKTREATTVDTTGNLKKTVYTLNYAYELVGDVDVTYKDDEGNILEATSIVKDAATLGEAYTTEQKEFKDYDFVSMEDGSAPAQGTVKADPQHVVYVYRKHRGDVIVHYVNEAGETIKDDVKDEDQAKVGTSYDTRDQIVKEIEKDGKLYRLQAAQTKGNETGTVVKGQTEVTYVYAEVKFGSVVVSYKDEEGNTISPDVTDTAKAEVGTAYDTTDHKPKEIEANGKLYRLVPAKTEGAETGSVVEGETKVTYIYAQVKFGDVTVHYKDEEGNVIADDVKDTDHKEVGTSYDTTDHKPAEITKDGKLYRLVPAKTEGAETGTVVEGNTDVTYVYAEVKYGSVIVSYKDEEGNTISPDVTDTAKAEVGTAYDTTDHKPKEIEANGKLYRLVPAKTEGAETGSIVEGETKVTYVYAEVKFGDVTVHYKDEEGNVIADDVKDTDHKEVGTAYDTTDHKPAEITKGGKLYRLVPAKTEGAETGTVVEGNTDVTYVYSEVKFGSVVVSYKDTEGNTISPDVTDTAKAEVGTDYDTTDHKPKEFSFNGKRYRLVPAKTEGAETGQITEGETKVTYVYEVIKVGSVVVHYVDENGQTIRPDYKDTVDAEVDTDYNTAESTDEKPLVITVNGKTYELVRVEGQEVGKVVEGLTEVTYVYKLKEVPVTPDKPGIPDKPEKPEVPVRPETPVTPEKPVTPVHKKELPQTGETSSTLAIAASVTAVLAALGLAVGKKKEEE